MDADTRFTLTALNVYPIKGCAGIALPRARLDAFGLEGDRRWMLVDAAGRFFTQREAPPLARVRPELAGDGLMVHAPGQSPLTIEPRSGPTRSVTVWKDGRDAIDEGDEAATWFSTYIGRPLRLVRFDDRTPRLANARWVGDLHGRPGTWSRFSDGYPMLLVSEASVAALNTRLAAAGHPAIVPGRFRPNLVVQADASHEEDLVATLRQDGVTLRRVKPCTRCQVVDVDPATGLAGLGVLDTLAGYRADPSLDGAITFGQNVVVQAGIGETLTVGQAFDAEYAFDT